MIDSNLLSNASISKSFQRALTKLTKQKITKRKKGTERNENEQKEYDMKGNPARSVATARLLIGYRSIRKV